MVYVASILADLDFLAEVMIFSLMFFQALFMTSSIPKFYKAANLLVISI
jgi:hypothetical protein